MVEGTVDNHSSVDMIIAQNVGDYLVAHCNDWFWRRERDPLTLVGGFSIDMERLRRKTNDGEGIGSSSVCSHGNEVVGRRAVRDEGTLDGAIGKELG